MGLLQDSVGSVVEIYSTLKGVADEATTNGEIITATKNILNAGSDLLTYPLQIEFIGLTIELTDAKLDTLLNVVAEAVGLVVK